MNWGKIITINHSPTDLDVNNSYFPPFKNISGVACINAPIPPEETKLQLLYEPNSVIAFGDTVSYECLPGTFFEEDYNMPNFTLTCLTDGNFSDPLPWKNCLLPSSKPYICF